MIVELTIEDKVRASAIGELKRIVNAHPGAMLVRVIIGERSLLLGEQFRVSESVLSQLGEWGPVHISEESDPA